MRALTIRWMLGFIAWGSCVDALVTYMLVSRGLAYEANPIMNLCIQAGWPVFFLVKSILTFISLYVFWKLRDNEHVRPALVFCCLFMLALLIWHAIVVSSL